MRPRTTVRLLVLAIALPAGAYAADEKVWLLDDFESTAPKTGSKWETHFDNNKLGTTLTPKPFVVAKDGSPKSPKGHAHISGHLGKDMEPWPFAFLRLYLNAKSTPVDLSGAKSLRFYTKGDGRTYSVQLVRASIKDYAHFEYRFEAPKEWTLITIPFDKFTQPDWGQQVEKEFKDVTAVKFNAATRDADFDLHLDDVELVFDPAAKLPTP